MLPPAVVPVVPVTYFGRELKFLGNRTFADLTITVINDEDFVVRNAMERWMNGLNSHSLNVRNPAALAPLGYSVDAKVTQFGKTGDLSPIDVDWGANDQIEEFTVTLAYQWWEAEEAGVV